MSNNKKISILAFCLIFIGIIIGNNVNKLAGYIICFLCAVIAVVFLFRDKK